MTKNSISALFLGVCLTAAIFSGCKKDDEEPTPAPSNTEKITGRWKLKAFTMSPGFFGQTDVYANLPTCQKDDTYTFKANGTLIIDQGADKCDTLGTKTGTWAWASGETKISIVAPGLPSPTIDVLVNDGATLKGSYTDTDPTVGTQKFTMTFTKQ